MARTDVGAKVSPIVVKSDKGIINKEFDNSFRVYNQSGFHIQRIHVDPEFKPIEDTFKDIDITINYSTAQENVP